MVTGRADSFPLADGGSISSSTGSPDHPDEIIGRDEPSSTALHRADLADILDQEHSGTRTLAPVPEERPADEVHLAPLRARPWNTARTDAENLLNQLLANGPVPQAEVEAAAGIAGLSNATLRRAKKRLGITSERQSVGNTGVGRWFWNLAQAARCSTDPQGNHVSEVSTLPQDEHVAPEQPAKIPDDGLGIPEFLDRKRWRRSSAENAP
jgi:hypothetical protein